MKNLDLSFVKGAWNGTFYGKDKNEIYIDGKKITLTAEQKEEVLNALQDTKPSIAKLYSQYLAASDDAKRWICEAISNYKNWQRYTEFDKLVLSNWNGEKSKMDADFTAAIITAISAYKADRDAEQKNQWILDSLFKSGVKI